MMIPKTIKQIKYNITPLLRKPEDIKYVVIHYTANYNKYADDNANADYFARESSVASADYIVDCDSYIQVNDWTKNYCWAVGDGKGKYGITNKNSISIEICVNKELDKVIENTILILQNDILPKLPHINYNHLVRHYDSSRKLCPIFFVNTQIKEIDPRWIDFKNKVFSKTKQILGESVINGINIAFSKGFLIQKEKWTNYCLGLKIATKEDLQWLFTKIAKSI